MRTRPRSNATVPTLGRHGIALDSMRETAILALLVGTLVWSLQMATKSFQQQTALDQEEPDAIQMLMLDSTGEFLWAVRKFSTLDCFSLPGLQLQNSTPLILPPTPCAVQLSVTEKCLATVRDDGTLEIYVNGDRVCEHRPHNDQDFCSLAMSKGGRIVVSGTTSGELHTWNRTGMGYEHHQHMLGSPVDHLAFRADGRRLAILERYSGDIRLWDVEQSSCTQSWPSKHEHCSAIAWSPEGGRIASVGTDGVLRVWNTDTGHQQWEIRADNVDPACVAFSPDGQLVATGGFATVVRVCSAETGRMVTEHRGHTAAVRTLAWALDSRTLYSSGADGKIRAWSAMDNILGSDSAMTRRHDVESP